MATKKKSIKKKTSAKKSTKSAKKKSAPKPAARKKMKSKAKIKSKAKTKTKPKAKTKAKAKAKIKTKTKAKAKVKSQTQPKAKSSKTKIAKQKKVTINSATIKIRDRLLQNQAELLNIIQSSQSIERNSTELNFSNEIDMASSLEGREMMFQLTSRDRNELKMIQEAIYRINNGTYGICDTCSKNISPKRLQILPLSSLCIECKESMEST